MLAAHSHTYLQMLDLDYCDPDFDLLLDELRNDTTSSEDYSSVSSSSTLSPPPLMKLSGKKAKAMKKSKFEDDSSIPSIDSDTLIVKPRILKTDIRRSYSTMFMNVLNNGDFPLIYGFFETFFCSNMQNSISRPNHLVTGVIEHVTYQQKGVKDVAMYWYSNLLTKPDAVVTLKECSIVSPLNTTESLVVTDFNFRATALLEELPTSFHNNPSKDVMSTAGTLVSVGRKRNVSNEEEDKSKTMRDMMASVDNAVGRLSLRPDPFQIDATGRLTFYLDENKRVKKIELNCKPNECMTGRV